MKLKEVQQLATGGVIGANASMGYVIKPLKHLHCTAQLQVVALFNERDQTWHRYVTNAPPEKLSATHMTAIYASGWEVELLFKEFKSGYRLEDIRAANPAANLCLISPCSSAGAYTACLERPESYDTGVFHMIGGGDFCDRRQGTLGHLLGPKAASRTTPRVARFPRNGSARSESKPTVAS